MNDRNDDLRARLSEWESPDTALRDRYRALLDERLGETWPLGRNARYALVATAGLAGFVVAGSLALTEPATTPTAVRGLLGMLALFGLGWAAFAVWALARRRGGFASERLIASRIAMGFTLAALLGLGLAATTLGKGAEAGPMLAAALGFLVLAAVGSTHARIEEAELAIREQLLRLESRIIKMEGAGRAQVPGPGS